MPEPIEQPEQHTPAPKKRARKAPGESALARLKKKYRLDDSTFIAANGPNGQPLGRGPVMDPEVIAKFNELDNTTDKRYVDWMLYQAGGGANHFHKSMEMWGEGSPETPPDEFFRKFEAEVTNRVRPDEVTAVARSLNVPQLPDLANEIGQLTLGGDNIAKFQNIKNLLTERGVGAGKEERIASDLVSLKLKQWIRDQLDTKVRDRVHAVFVFSRLLRGLTPEEAENEWQKVAPARKRDYLFGDQDALKWQLFGFSRHWPGKENIYERVYNEMRQFLINKERVERRNAQLDQYNAAIENKNASLPPDQQIALREPVQINLNIGKVKLTREGNLVYSGDYPNLIALANVNKEILDLPMRERVAADVRYATPQHQWTRDAKLYSDANLDVLVPLTVAAAIRSGHPSWPVSSPEQLKDVKSQGHYSLGGWSQFTSGQHGHAEWNASQAVPVFFHFKLPSIPPNYQRVMMTAFVDDMAEFSPPYTGTFWKPVGGTGDTSFSGFISMLKQALPRQDYFAAVRSVAKAMKAIQEWAGGYDPQALISDYIAHHRERMQGRRGLREMITIRARQVIDLLTS